ncbi:tetratricopeptide repeat protein [Rhizobium sp. BK251]|uniref:TPR end-of-group domain-containing protein n=1 Tax=Rhizobium sp. BK251 TaxID=2512125 RepID=UPI0010465203|nr:tetratricopeptide repeat protein [Rhizobium sp. BK251]TCL72612.1 adenylate cyclase [Rhizobium sp. BK251]
MERRLTAILAADVVGYSRLMSADEAGTLAAVKKHRAEFLDPTVRDHKGRIVKLTGDGVLIEFSSVVNAVACAAAIQQGMLQRNVDVARERRVELRIGIHLGDVIVEDGDIFGDGVNVAARLEGIAETGGIAVSASVRDHVGSRLDLVFEDRGEHFLKNIEQSIRVYEISFGRGKDDAGKTMTERPSRRQSIAVLPFTNMSNDPGQEYFSDGITEDIITDLSKISGLHVVARNTVFTYKGHSVKVKQVAQELGVNFILEGSVRKVGERVRITGQLIDAKNGGHLWADRYDRDLTDIFAIQDEITHAIVNQLKIKLLPEEKKAIESDPTTNVEAYTYYLRGRQFLHSWTRPYMLLARRMFSKAVELDPSYARAYAGIADCESALRDWHPDEFSVESILVASAKAIALDPNLAEAHASRGLALHQDGHDAEAAMELEQALALDPDLYEANFHYGRFLFMQGNYEGAIVYFKRAAELRPDDYLSPIHIMSSSRALGRTADLEHWARIGIERAERALNLNPENSGPAHRGALALAHLGDADRARKWAARALAIQPDDIVARYNTACVYSLLGDHNEALDTLEALMPFSSRYQILWFQHDSDLDPIRNYPRFKKMVEAIAATAAAEKVADV